MNKTKVAEPLELADLYAALSDQTRLRLLNLMAGGEVCVCFFVEVLDQPQPTISRHLAYLRNAGIVEDRRDGKWIHYRISMPKDPVVQRALESALAAIRSQGSMQREVKKLQAACCSPRVSETLRRAPKPRTDG